MSDIELAKMFLEQFIEMLKKYGSSSDQYKADTIEDLIRRL